MARRDSEVYLYVVGARVPLAECAQPDGDSPCNMIVTSKFQLLVRRRHRLLLRQLEEGSRAVADHRHGLVQVQAGHRRRRRVGQHQQGGGRGDELGQVQRFLDLSCTLTIQNPAVHFQTLPPHPLPDRPVRHRVLHRVRHLPARVQRLHGSQQQQRGQRRRAGPVGGGRAEGHRPSGHLAVRGHGHQELPHRSGQGLAQTDHSGEIRNCGVFKDFLNGWNYLQAVLTGVAVFSLDYSYRYSTARFTSISCFMLLPLVTFIVTMTMAL